MGARSIFPNCLVSQSSLCCQCLRLKAHVASPYQKRQISRNVLLKRELAEKAWDRKAEQIKNGDGYNLWDVFKARGYVKDIAGTDKQISELMRTKRIGAYVGIDPTAQSLHVGHLLPLMALFWMYMHGYRAVTVIGGATAKIGDPTDRLQSRDKIPRSDMAVNITKVHYQMKRMWANVDTQARKFGYEKEWVWDRALLNNSQWYNNTPFIEVVTKLFKGLRMGPLMSRESVKRRMEDGGEGMPLDEFIYPLIQAWDWWHLYTSPKGIQMQIGGSDQYGNIITGLEAISYLRKTNVDPRLDKPNTPANDVVGFTVPLLTDSSGAKFGKSAGNAVWLDPFMTSSYDLYGYFMRRPDADVENLLKLLTFLPMDKVMETMEEHKKDPSRRVAQHALASEVVSLVHSAELAQQSQQKHRALYSKAGGTARVEPGSVDTTNQVEVKFPEEGPASVGLATSFKVDIELPESLMFKKSIPRILYAAGLVPSVTEGNRLAASQGAYIAGSPGQKSAVNKGMSYGELTFTPVKNWHPKDTSNFLIDGELIILRRGKHFIRIIKVVSDEKWAAEGRLYPGEIGEIRKLRESLQDVRDVDPKDLTPARIRQFKDDLAADNLAVKARQQGLRSETSSSPDQSESSESREKFDLLFPPGMPGSKTRLAIELRQKLIGDRKRELREKVTARLETAKSCREDS